MIFTQLQDGKYALLTSKTSGISEAGEFIHFPREIEVLQEDAVPASAINTFRECGASISRAGVSPSRFWGATSLSDLRD